MQSWLIGSSTDCDVVVDQPTVSGRHCRLTRVADGFQLEDLDSRNGTFVNGLRIQQVTTISRADTVTLGASAPLPLSRLGAEPEAVGQSSPVVLRIGREPDNDFVVDHPSVSGYHARVIRTEEHSTIEDLGSTNGTSLNSSGLPIQRAILSWNDTVVLGAISIPAAQLLAKLPMAASLRSVPVPAVALDSSPVRFSGSSLVLGRDPGCERVVDLPNVSGRHARLYRSGRRLLIEDLGSANGTFVDGERIRGSLEVQHGSRIGLGSWTTSLEWFESFEPGGARVETVDLSLDQAGIPERFERVSLTVEPGEFVAIVGVNGLDPSGFLAAIAGRVSPSSGSILIDSEDIADLPSNSVGWVGRPCSIHPELAPAEAVRFAAQLRSSTRPTEPAIQAVLDKVGGLEAMAGPGRSKRVEIAVALLANPRVLFLDQPTASLVESDQRALLSTLRELADGGLTVVASFDHLAIGRLPLFDLLAVLARDEGSDQAGRLVYFGPAFPEAVEALRLGASTLDTAEHGEAVRWTFGERPVNQAASDFESSPIHNKYVLIRRLQRPFGGEPRLATRFNPSPWLGQWWTLTRREVALQTRRWKSSLPLLFQGPILAALTVLAVLSLGRPGKPVDMTSWTSLRRGVELACACLSLGAIWIGAFSAIFNLVTERWVYRRERDQGLKTSAYLASKLVVLGTLVCLQTMVLVAIVHRGLGLVGPGWPMLGVAMLTAVVGLALGLVVSALSRSRGLALGFLLVVLVPLVGFGGIFRPLGESGGLVRFVAQGMPTRWANEGLILPESDARPTAFELSESGSDPQLPTDLAERSFPFERGRVGVMASSTALGALLLGLLGWLWLILLPDRKRGVISP